MRIQALLLKGIKQKLHKKLSIFPACLLARANFIIDMHAYLITALSITSVIALGLCIFAFKVPIGSFFQLYNYSLSVLVFVLIEALMVFLRVAYNGVTEPLKVVRDKMPIFLSLLRLPNTSNYNQRVQFWSIIGSEGVSDQLVPPNAVNSLLLINWNL